MEQPNRKIIAFGASNSRLSINKTFATYATGFFPEYEIEILDLNDFEVPLFGVDKEEKEGIPKNAILFYKKMREANFLIISMAEHNGSYTAAFKNLFDWISRHVSKCWENQQLFLLSTSTGKRGGKGVMDAALIRFPIHGVEILENFSLPSFNLHFSSENGIMDEELKLAFMDKINLIREYYGLERTK